MCENRPKAVTVAGVTVTQATLEAMFAALDGTHGIPAGHRPRLEMFGRLGVAESSAEPEQILFSLIEGGEVPEWFAQQFLGAPRPDRPRESPVAALMRAGIPRIAAMRAPTEAAGQPAQMRAWADAYRGPGTPWLCVMSPDADGTRLSALAHAALGAHRAMEGGRAPWGEIAYVTARDLCGMVDTAEPWGAGSKWATLQGLNGCQLLIIDGLGEERRTAASLETISQAVEGRWRRQAPTVLALPGRLSDWARPYGRIDAGRAEATTRRIVHAVEGYEADEGRARENRAVNVVRLAT